MLSFLDMIGPLAKGFALTFKHLFRKPITINYPDQKMPMFPRYRGKQVLMRDENGLEKCVACGLCAVACPADAIYLEAAENDGPAPRMICSRRRILSSSSDLLCALTRPGRSSRSAVSAISHHLHR